MSIFQLFFINFLNYFICIILILYIFISVTFSYNIWDLLFIKFISIILFNFCIGSMMGMGGGKENKKNDVEYPWSALVFSNKNMLKIKKNERKKENMLLLWGV